MSQYKKIYINGMTCVSCEHLISEDVKKIPNVEKVEVSHKTQIAQVYFSNEKPDSQEIIKTIEKLGYSASENPIDKKEKKNKATGAQWAWSLFIVFCIYLVYKYFSWIGVFDWIQIDSKNIGYGAAFLIGIVASMSTCLAVVGAVVMSFGAKYKTVENKFSKNAKPHLLFHAGRIGSFFLLGGLLGILGNFVQFSASVLSIFTILIALILFWLALNILGFLPSMTTLGIHMPKKSMGVWNKLKDSEHAMAPILLGAFTFFLPCGFTQSMQLFAVSSGNFWVGGLTLAIFALGTSPILFSIGMASSKASSKKNVVMQKVIGFIILAFAFYTLSSGLAVRGIGLTDFLKNTNAQSNSAVSIVNSEGVQVVKMAVEYSGYNPEVIKIKAGVPVRWEIDGKQVTGCTSEIVVPDLNIKKKLNQGLNIVEFTATEKGTLNFSCWMGMVRGKFIVE
ncbi:MAG: sulfite exporter TauE/SafE family protein [Candidatus Magasanikbacteria bacterium]